MLKTFRHAQARVARCGRGEIRSMIYQKVLDDQAELSRLIREHDLKLPGVAAGARQAAAR